MRRHRILVSVLIVPLLVACIGSETAPASSPEATPQPTGGCSAETAERARQELGTVAGYRYQLDGTVGLPQTAGRFEESLAVSADGIYVSPGSVSLRFDQPTVEETPFLSVEVGEARLIDGEGWVQIPALTDRWGSVNDLLLHPLSPQLVVLSPDPVGAVLDRAAGEDAPLQWRPVSEDLGADAPCVMRASMVWSAADDTEQMITMSLDQMGRVIDLRDQWSGFVDASGQSLDRDLRYAVQYPDDLPAVDRPVPLAAGSLGPWTAERTVGLENEAIVRDASGRRFRVSARNVSEVRSNPVITALPGNTFLQVQLSQQAIDAGARYGFHWEVLAFSDDVPYFVGDMPRLRVNGGPEPALLSGPFEHTGEIVEGWLNFQVPQSGPVVLRWVPNSFIPEMAALHILLRE